MVLAPPRIGSSFVGDAIGPHHADPSRDTRLTKVVSTLPQRQPIGQPLMWHESTAAENGRACQQHWSPHWPHVPGTSGHRPSSAWRALRAQNTCGPSSAMLAGHVRLQWKGTRSSGAVGSAVMARDFKTAAPHAKPGQGQKKGFRTELRPRIPWRPLPSAPGVLKLCAASI